MAVLLFVLASVALVLWLSMAQVFSTYTGWVYDLLSRENLVAERISQARAAAELQALNKRQKGGWLLARIQRILTGLGLSKS